MKKVKEFPEITASAIFLNRYYKIIIFIIIILVMFIGYLLVIKSQALALKEQSPKLTEKLAELKDAEEYYKKLQQLENTIKDFQRKNAQQVAKLEEVLPLQSQIPELLAQLEAIVKRTEFNLVDLSLSELSPTTAASGSIKGEGQPTALLTSLPPQVKVIQINLSLLGGDYFAFKNLLKDLEQHIRIFDITSLTFEGGRKDTPTQYLLNLQTYYFES